MSRFNCVQLKNLLAMWKVGFYFAWMTETEKIIELKTALKELIGVVDAHDLESLDCDGTGEPWCECLENAVRKARRLIINQTLTND